MFLESYQIVSEYILINPDFSDFRQCCIMTLRLCVKCEIQKKENSTREANKLLSLDDSFLTSIPLLLTKLRPDNLCLFSHVSHTCQISSTYVEAQYYDLADAYQCC